MPTQAQYLQLISKIETDIEGFLAASIVDADSGMTLATKSRRPGFNLEVASAYNSELVKAKKKTIRTLGLEAHLEDMLLTLADQIHLIKMLDENVFIYVAANRQVTNPALLRVSVRTHSDRLAA